MDGQESNQLEEDPVALESLSLRPKQKEISKKRQEKPNTSQDVEDVEGFGGGLHLIDLWHDQQCMWL